MQVVLTEAEIFHLVIQIVCGMVYLTEEKIVYCDLATRNCLLSSESNVQIADFGYRF